MRRLFLLLIVFMSCNRPDTTNYRPSPYLKDANKVTASAAKKIQQETGLKLIGTGGGMMGQINCMAMSFAYYGELSMEKSRELLVYCVEEYLAAINANEKIKPHLRHFPFTQRDVEIRIFVFQTNKREPPLGTLSVASQIGGRVNFFLSEPWPVLEREIHEEPYEEARKLVSSNTVKYKVK